MRSPRPKKAPAVAPAESIVQELANLYFELSRLRSTLVQSLTSELGISLTQARTLVLMDPEKALTMREVAKVTFLEPSNLTGIIDKLEARGLVKRSLAATDRRVKIVSLTRPGMTLRTQLLDRIREPAPWMRALSPRDQRELMNILRKAFAFAQANPEPVKS